ncbi:MAG: LuxE/PaaK family acyltransferase [Bacteroidia bacterium]
MEKLIIVNYPGYMNIYDFIEIPQFSLDKTTKAELLFSQLKELHNYHCVHCSDYKKISDITFPDAGKAKSIAELPFLPVSIFKTQQLKSITDDEVYKVLTSSGTTGSVPSSIYLDTDTAKLQTVSLSKIITHVIGKSRLPMLIIDSKEVLKNRNSFSARGAGIVGLSVFGKDHTYALNEDYTLNEETVAEFLKKYNGQPVFIFGFTYMIWQYLLNNSKNSDIDLSNALLIHSGGWKKLIEFAVDNATFKRQLFEKFKLKKVYNFYGMIEQIGSVYIENSEGYLHCPNFADIIIRNPVDFSVQPNGKEGLIQVVSALPKSYPGHSLLTEDIGVCMGEDDSKIAWKGKYFKIIGRAAKAELRGCSDTFASNHN